MCIIKIKIDNRNLYDMKLCLVALIILNDWEIVLGIH